MNTEIEFKAEIVDDSNMFGRERLQGSLRGCLLDPRPALKQFHTYMLGRTGQTFRALAHGGFFRGVHWWPFSDTYERRPSGRKVTPRSNLLRDTGRLAAAAGTTRVWLDQGRTLEMTTRNVAYGPAQQSLRPFLFFSFPEDAQQAGRIVADYVRRK